MRTFISPYPFAYCLGFFFAEVTSAADQAQLSPDVWLDRWQIPVPRSSATSGGTVL